jgi:hypothetical protein
MSSKKKKTRRRSSSRSNSHCSMKEKAIQMVPAKENLQDGKYFPQPKIFCGNILYFFTWSLTHTLEVRGFLYLQAQLEFAVDGYRKRALRMAQIGAWLRVNLIRKWDPYWAHRTEAEIVIDPSSKILIDMGWVLAQN